MNDHLPEHPDPSSGFEAVCNGDHQWTREEIQRAIDGMKIRRTTEAKQTGHISPVLLALLAIVGLGLVMFLAGLSMGKASTEKASQADLQRSFEAGVSVGAICAHEPDQAACDPEAMQYAGVL